MFGVPPQFFPIILWSVTIVYAERREICDNEAVWGECGSDEVMIFQAALYGRMSLGKCVERDLGYLGCQNDVLFLADRWCSGRRKCTVTFDTYNELDEANLNCRDLQNYLDLEYSCVRVLQAMCTESSPTVLSEQQGYLSAIPTDSGCGGRKASWEIETQPGQTVSLWLLDFGATQRQTEDCVVYGYILERAVGANTTICAARRRKSLLYKSTGGQVEVPLIPRGGQGELDNYLIEYQVLGCGDISPPAHAWHKREGSEAVIGCKSDDRVWGLRCTGNTWEGKVGNCSKPGNEDTSNKQAFSKGPMTFSSVILLTGVVCAAVLLVIVVVVAGTVYIKKQSIRHDVKLKSDYGCPGLHPSDVITGYDETKGRQPPRSCDDNQPLVRVWDNQHAGPRVLGTGSVSCACSTMVKDTRENGTRGVGVQHDLLQ